MGRAQATAAFSRGLRPAHSPSCPREARADTQASRVHTEKDCSLRESPWAPLLRVEIRYLDSLSLSLSLSLPVSRPQSIDRIRSLTTKYAKNA